MVLLLSIIIIFFQNFWIIFFTIYKSMNHFRHQNYKNENIETKYWHNIRKGKE